MRRISTMLAVAAVLVGAAAVQGARGQGPGDGPGAFLQALNHWRAQHGRAPVGWDPTLAAYASRNDGVHAPGSSGGAAQCWAPVGGYLAALELWKRSPGHASILLGATSAVGVSPCRTGVTANVR